MKEFVFPFRRKGEPWGFTACRGPLWAFKVDETKTTETKIVIDLELLKTNLRRLVKSKQATILKAGEVEAVVVPANLRDELFRT